MELLKRRKSADGEENHSTEPDRQRELEVFDLEFDVLDLGLDVFDSRAQILFGHQFDHDEVSYRLCVRFCLHFGNAVVPKTACERKRIECEHHCLCSSEILAVQFVDSLEQKENIGKQALICDARYCYDFLMRSQY